MWTYSFIRTENYFFFWGGGANMICFAARKLDSTKKLSAETCLSVKSPSGQIVTGAIFTADLCSDSRRVRSWAENTDVHNSYHLT